MGRETNDRIRNRITKSALPPEGATNGAAGNGDAGSAAAGATSGARGGAATKAADLWLGRQLRALRKGRELSLTELAERTGLSIGNLSQIERGVSSPSVRSLKKLSEVLQVPVGDLFQETDLPPAEEMNYIVRRKTRPMLHLGDTGLQKELLTPTTPGALQMLLVTLEPGGSSGPEHYTHRGEEAGLILSGALELFIEDERFLLKEGDTFRFKSTQPHRFVNGSAKVTTVLWVTTPPGY
ncbi:MAG: cupin domain-containing protein [Rhodospirillaceae bacterium]|nr:MAG: cupin domain-containing protein [Rhodospirillaceae bacterium]